MSWHLLVHKQTLGQHLVRIPKAFPVFDLANIWLHPYFVCMRWKSTVAMNKYYMGYFCCTLYLVLLCWAHWSRRTAATGSSLLASGSHLSFPWVLVTASHKEARFHYEDIGLCKKIYIPFSCASPFKPELSHICNSVICVSWFCIPFKKLLQGPPCSHPTPFAAKLLSGVQWESATSICAEDLVVNIWFQFALNEEDVRLVLSRKQCEKDAIAVC